MSAASNATMNDGFSFFHNGIGYEWHIREKKYLVLEANTKRIDLGTQLSRAIWQKKTWRKNIPASFSPFIAVPFVRSRRECFEVGLHLRQLDRIMDGFKIVFGNDFARKARDAISMRNCHPDYSIPTGFFQTT